MFLAGFGPLTHSTKRLQYAKTLCLRKWLFPGTFLISIADQRPLHATALLFYATLQKQLSRKYSEVRFKLVIFETAHDYSTFTCLPFYLQFAVLCLCGFVYLCCSCFCRFFYTLYAFAASSASMYVLVSLLSVLPINKNIGKCCTHILLLTFFFWTALVLKGWQYRIKREPQKKMLEQHQNLFFL